MKSAYYHYALLGDDMKQKINKAIYRYAAFMISLLLIFTCLPLPTYAEMILTAENPFLHPDTQMSLNWSGVPGAGCYVLKRKVTGDPADAATIAVIDADTTLNPTRFLDQGPLLPLTDYTFTVEAYASADDITGLPLDSGTVSASTYNVTPPVIDSAVFDINTRRITVSWTPSSSAVVSNNVIIDDGAPINILSSAGNSYTTAALAPGDNDPVSFKVSSGDGAGHISSVSDEVLVTPIEVPVLTASVSDGSCLLSWGDYQNINEFVLERSKWSNNSWGAWTVISSALSSTGRVDTPPTAGTYRYRLKAVGDYHGFSAITAPIYKPGAPTNITVMPVSLNSVNLTWINDPENTSGLLIERRSHSEEYQALAYLSYSASSYVDEDVLIQNSTYYYRVTAYENINNFSRSQEVTINTSPPAAPSNFSININDETELMLTWTDGSSNESGFSIQRSVDGGIFSEIAVCPANSTSYTDTAVAAGHTYTYRVQAVNAFGSSAYIERSVSGTVASSPISLAVTSVSSSSISLSWSFQGQSGLTVLIERKTGASGTWTQLATTYGGALSYTDTGLVPNTQYFYRVRSVLNTNVYSSPYPNNDDGIGASTKMSAITLSCNAADSNRILLSWSGGGNISEYSIERKVSGGEYTVIKSVAYGTNSWYDTEVIPNVVYLYRIKGKSGNNETEYSNEVTVANSYLAQPTNLTAVINSDKAVELTWTDNSTSESGFEIWRGTYDTYTGNKLYATVGENTTSFIDEMVQPGLNYYYSVRAFSLANSTYSGFSATVSTAAASSVNAPSDLVLTAVSDQQILLSWKDNSTNEMGYYVERKLSGTDSWSQIASLPANTTSYSDSSLSPYISYTYRIKAYSSYYGIYLYSNEATISTGKPSAPADVKAVAVSSDKVRINWTDTSNNEQYFRIDRKRADDRDYMYAGMVNANTTAFTDIYLIPGATYYYKVTAYNQSGSSTSAVVSVRTNKKVTFKDIDNHWAKTAIEEIGGRGVTIGSNGYFKPDASITRAEFVSFSLRAFGLGSVNTGSMADVSPGQWYYGELMAARKYGIISPDSSGRFYPDSPITKEDMAIIIIKTIKAAGKIFKSYSNSVLESYTDRDLISPKALSSMAALCGENILTASDNMIYPKNSVTRAEAATVIVKVLDRY